MANATRDLVVKICDTDKYHEIDHEFGGAFLRDVDWDAVDRLRLGTPSGLRELARQARALVDRNVPNRPRAYADAIEALADATERRPVRDSDRARWPQGGEDVLWPWINRCRGRSPLLGPLVDELENIRNELEPVVGNFRDAVAMLADADLLLPGVDAALSPVLAPYAALLSDSKVATR